MFIRFPYIVKLIKVTGKEYLEFIEKYTICSFNDHYELAKNNQDSIIGYFYKDKKGNWLFLPTDQFLEEYTETNNNLVVDIILPSKTFERTKYKLLMDLTVNGITVPKGFITDGATTPRIVWSLFPPTGRYFLAAVLHDYLLENDECWRTANKAFKEALLTYKVKPWIVTVLYYSVQIYQYIKREVLKVKGNECK